jgi:hypothetical protein
MYPTRSVVSPSRLPALIRALATILLIFLSGKAHNDVHPHTWQSRDGSQCLWVGSDQGYGACEHLRPCGIQARGSRAQPKAGRGLSGLSSQPMCEACSA